MQEDAAQDSSRTGPAPNPGAQDPAVVVQSLLQQMQNRFEQMSSSIIGRIDEMSERIEQLEKSIENLMMQTGVQKEHENN